MTSFSSVFGSGFNAEKYAAQNPANNSFEPLPAGNYLLEVEESELRKSKAGNDMLHLCFAVADGQHVGRKIFSNLNIGHPSQKVRDIALQSLASLCKAAGIAEIQNDTDLIGKRVIGRVKVRPAQNGYEASNDVSMFSAPTTGNAPVPAAAATKQNVPWA